MPNIGDMVLIPKGSVNYPPDVSRPPGLVRDDFFIDVFPVTNKQYHEFLLDHPEIEVPYIDHYAARDTNWNKVTRMFQEGKGDHPVVSVGRSELRAFCDWRAQRDPGKEFSLPNRFEWLRAAGGDGREYPWGDQYDSTRCNAGESRVGGYTSVRRYPAGASKYGVWDMAGNAWEKTRDGCIFGGGGDPRWARLVFAPWDVHSTDVGDDEIGFRCVARPSKKIAVMCRSELVTASFNERMQVYDIEGFEREEFANIERSTFYVQKPFGQFRGDVIVDPETGLMWEVSGSDSKLTYEGAAKYVRKLNSAWFAGYDDWRLPTVPELTSLIRRNYLANRCCMDPIFGNTEASCWSVDRCPTDFSWYVNFMAINVDTLKSTQEMFARCVRTRLLFEFHG